MLIRYVDKTNKCTQTFKSILYYKHIKPTTCFGHNCVHPKNDMLQRLQESSTNIEY